VEDGELTIVSFLYFIVSGCPNCHSFPVYNEATQNEQVVFCPTCQSSFVLLPKKKALRVRFYQQARENVPSIRYVAK